MTILRRLHRRLNETRSEDGASLILVILFVVVFSVVAATILDFASTGFKTATAIKETRSRLHSADGAMDGAINAIRSSDKGYTSAGACPTFNLAATSTDPAVDVTCTPDTASTGGVFDDQPAWAILTLGKAAGEGINKDGNFHTVIAGGAFSSKDMTMSGGSSCKDVDDESCNALTVLGDAIALGNCTPNTGSPTFTPTRLYTPAGSDMTCLRGATDVDRENRGKLPSLTDSSGRCSPDVTSPSTWPSQCGYPTALGWPEVLDAQTGAQVVTTFNGSVDPPAKCQVSNTLVKFSPGLYTQKLDSLIPAACSGAGTWWLSPSDSDCAPTAPGVYYFDFPTGSTAWDASSKSVVGGKLTTSCSLVGSPPKSTAASVPALPGGCVDGASGVQLIFGGGTKMHIDHNSHQLDICTSAPDVSLTKQRVVIYGLPTGAKDAAIPNAVQSATGASSTTFANPTFALTKDAVATCVVATCAHANLMGANSSGTGGVKTASLVVNAFGDIPLGSTVTGASLEVTHQEQDTGGTPFDISVTMQAVDALSATATPATQPCLTAPDKLTASGSLHTSVCNILPAITGAPFGPYKYRTFNGIDPITVKFDADLADQVADTCKKGVCSGGSAAETGTVDVDSVQLTVSYIPPGFEATSCTGSCRLLESQIQPTTELLGTVYSPTAAIAIDVHNHNFTNFSRGVVVRSLDLTASASNKQTDQSPISLPGSGSGSVRIVKFTATIDGKTRLRARVRYTDKDPSNNAFAGYKVEVLNWEVVR